MNKPFTRLNSQEKKLNLDYSIYMGLKSSQRSTSPGFYRPDLKVKGK